VSFWTIDVVVAICRALVLDQSAACPVFFWTVVVAEAMVHSSPTK
jgi:hypothetical protein